MAVPWRSRIALASALGFLAGYRAYAMALAFPAHKDFTQVWFAAQAMLAGRNPYLLIGPGRAFEWNAPLFYPLPAAVIVAPLAPLTEAVAGGIFMGVSGACFAWALMRYGYAPVLGIFGAGFVTATESMQWASLLSSAIVLTPLAAFWIAKPTIATAFFVANPTRRALAWAVGGGLVFSLIAFAFQPQWPMHWLTALHATRFERGQGNPYVPPVFMPWGFLVLAAAARWRRPEARLLAALACVPQTLLMYESVPLFLIPRTWFESIGLVVLSYVANSQMVNTGVNAHDVDHSGRLLVLWLYLPATLMVLRRPNEGVVPAWLEARMAQWPAWVRGAPTRSEIPHAS